MSWWLGKVSVLPKPSVVDPQGLAVLDGLHALGFAEVAQVRVGKRIDVLLDAPDRPVAEARLREMAETLLANTLIEGYEIAVESAPDASEIAP